MEENTMADGIFTDAQLNYVETVSDKNLRSHLLHQVRLRDNMEADRNAFEKEANELRKRLREAVAAPPVSLWVDVLDDVWPEDARIGIGFLGLIVGVFAAAITYFRLDTE